MPSLASIRFTVTLALIVLVFIWLVFHTIRTLYQPARWDRRVTDAGMLSSVKNFPPVEQENYLRDEDLRPIKDEAICRPNPRLDVKISVGKGRNPHYVNIEEHDRASLRRPKNLSIESAEIQFLRERLQ
ncbi:MAG: hypothetical protein MMC33_002439 [Icmadophila ericetorum]|nr:hypothetical protein [Icmadophila ericetorum]